MDKRWPNITTWVKLGGISRFQKHILQHIRCIHTRAILPLPVNVLKEPKRPAQGHSAAYLTMSNWTVAISQYMTKLCCALIVLLQPCHISPPSKHMLSSCMASLLGLQCCHMLWK